mmetsp:Transcript_107927/g.348428  ORF Transcript_107927/g.348428 Transcript_107927/m.348428 type:complete len:225 (-) Transcript_107927:11-685(-)
MAEAFLPLTVLRRTAWASAGPASSIACRVSATNLRATTSVSVTRASANNSLSFLAQSPAPWSSRMPQARVRSGAYTHAHTPTSTLGHGCSHTKPPRAPREAPQPPTPRSHPTKPRPSKRPCRSAPRRRFAGQRPLAPPGPRALPCRACIAQPGQPPPAPLPARTPGPRPWPGPARAAAAQHPGARPRRAPASRRGPTSARGPTPAAPPPAKAGGPGRCAGWARA